MMSVTITARCQISSQSVGDNAQSHPDGCFCFHRPGTRPITTIGLSPAVLGFLMRGRVVATHQAHNLAYGSSILPPAIGGVL